MPRPAPQRNGRNPRRLKDRVVILPWKWVPHISQRCGKARTQPAVVLTTLSNAKGRKNPCDDDQPLISPFSGTNPNIVIVQTGAPCKPSFGLSGVVTTSRTDVGSATR